MRNAILHLIERRTLAFANRQRRRAGAPTLAELPLGWRFNADRCPVANALPGPSVRVLPHHWLDAEGRWHLLPPAPALFLRLFDSGRAYRQYRIPGWLVRLGRDPITLGRLEAARAVERDREPTAV